MQSTEINVLLVAHSIQNKAGIVKQFESDRMNLTIAGDIEKAKKLLLNSTPNIVVSDTTLPDGQGIDILENINNKKFPLLLLSEQLQANNTLSKKTKGLVTEIEKSEPTINNLPQITKKTYQLWEKDNELSRAIERNKRQKREIKKLQEELNRFVYSVSHELRSPMSTMTGLINVARMEESKNNIDEYLNFMHESMTKLDTYVKDLSNYSENRRTESKIRKFDIKKIVDRVLEKQAITPDYKKVKIDVSIQHDQPVFSDPNRIELILNHLVTNAIKHQDSSKAEPTVAIDIEVKRLKIIINIIDNGSGIESEHLNNVFKMFYRANETSAGSGLGLFIAKETVEKLNGTIHIRSFIKKGTNVTVVLPNRQR